MDATGIKSFVNSWELLDLSTHADAFLYCHVKNTKIISMVYVNGELLNSLKMMAIEKILDD